MLIIFYFDTLAEAGPGAVPLLHELESRGYRLGVSAPYAKRRDVVARLQGAGTLQYFDEFYYAGDELPRACILTRELDFPAIIGYVKKFQAARKEYFRGSSSGS